MQLLHTPHHQQQQQQAHLSCRIPLFTIPTSKYSQYQVNTLKSVTSNVFGLQQLHAELLMARPERLEPWRGAPTLCTYTPCTADIHMQDGVPAELLQLRLVMAAGQKSSTHQIPCTCPLQLNCCPWHQLSPNDKPTA
jgi:hypothetical protein